MWIRRGGGRVKKKHQEENLAFQCICLLGVGYTEIISFPDVPYLNYGYLNGDTSGNHQNTQAYLN